MPRDGGAGVQIERGPVPVPDVENLSGDSLAEPPNDRTLIAATGEPDSRAFPETSDVTRFVLYQTESGGLDLRWHLQPEALEHARAVFGNAASPMAQLRLLKVDDGGKALMIADAPLPADEAGADGVARYDQGGEGLLMAEIGLISPTGGWVLVARSNRLQAARPVGAAFLHASPTEDVEPPLLPAMDVRQARPAADVIGRVEPRLEAFRALADQASDQSVFDRVDAGIGSEGQFDRMPDPVSSGDTTVPTTVEQAIGHEVDGADGVVEAPGIDGPSGRIRAGSGPIRRAHADDGAEIHAELVVSGSGAPGAFLDLGGHRYQIGSGGRFVFRLPIDDPDLVMTLLSGLPELPVVAREREDGESDI